MDEDEIQDKVEYKAHVEDRVEDGFEESKIKRTMGTRWNTQKCKYVQAFSFVFTGKDIEEKRGAALPDETHLP